MPELGPETPEKDKPTVDYQKWGNRAQWVSAIATTTGVIVAACAIGVAWWNYQTSVAEQRNKLSADALLAWSRDQPPNTRACLGLLRKLKTEELATIIDREGFSLLLRGADAPPLLKEALACFSDQDDISKFLNNGNLTRRGVALLASRANAILDSDSFIASLLLKKIGNPDMFERVRDVICRDDAPIIDNLPKDERTLDSLSSLRRLIERPYPDGCKGHPKIRRP